MLPRIPPSIGPKMKPRPNAAPINPKLRARPLAEVTSDAYALATEKLAPVIPPITRASSMNHSDGASARRR